MIRGLSLSGVNRDPEEKTDILCVLLCVYVFVCVFTSLCQDVWGELSAGGYLGDESWGKALGEVKGYKWVKGWS